MRGPRVSVDGFHGFGYSDALHCQAAASMSRGPYGAMILGRHRRQEDRSRAASWSSLLFYSLSLPSIGPGLEKRGEERGLHFYTESMQGKGGKGGLRTFLLTHGRCSLGGSKEAFSGPLLTRRQHVGRRCSLGGSMLGAAAHSEAACWAHTD